MNTLKFDEKKSSVDFYQSRYEHGYMAHWPEFDKKRLAGLIQSLNLPQTGIALDFGCGRGIFTAVIKQMLPGWTVYGCDVSKEAIQSATVQEGITFFEIGDARYAGLKAGFIHSHHVLEHAFSEHDAASDIVQFAAGSCIMLHSLPGNHEGGFEYSLCQLVENGLDTATGKFFFEDEAHLRRLNVQQAESLFQPGGFRLTHAYYANQLWGALKWIAESPLSLILQMTGSANAISVSASVKLAGYRCLLLLLWFSYFSVAALQSNRGIKTSLFKTSLQLLLLVMFFWITLPVKYTLDYLARREWDKHKTDRRGSDMFLIFER